MTWKDEYAKHYKLKTDSSGNKEWYNPETNSFIKEEMDHVMQTIDKLFDWFYELRDYVENSDIHDKSNKAAYEYYYLDHVVSGLREVQSEIGTIQSMYDRDDISMIDKLYMWVDMGSCAMFLSSVGDHLKSLDEIVATYEDKKPSGAYKSMTNIVRDVEFKHKKKGDKK